MVKAYSQEHTYKHPWERVTSASWRKFADPENKRTLSHILEVDTLNHKLDSDSGKLYTTRAITIHAPGPWFLRKIVGQDICHCVESTVVDAQTRSMQLATKNISLQKYVEVEEKIRYDPHPENPKEWTICRQETSIRIKPLSALASMAEKIEQKCAEKFQQNSAKGREVMERMCFLGEDRVSCGTNTNSRAPPPPPSPLNLLLLFFELAVVTLEDDVSCLQGVQRSFDDPGSEISTWNFSSAAFQVLLLELSGESFNYFHTWLICSCWIISFELQFCQSLQPGSLLGFIEDKAREEARDHFSLGKYAIKVFVENTEFSQWSEFVVQLCFLQVLQVMVI